MRPFIAFIAIAVMSAPLSAQVIYEPANVQFGSGDGVFYYGGTDAHTVRMGHLTSARQRIFSPIDNQPLRVYSDLLPGINAATYGFDVADARNELNANIPNHFRKSELMRDARRDAGITIIPQRPLDEMTRGSIVIRPYVVPVRKTYRPVLVIPKSILKRPLPTAPSM
jgi:hypothetical protein